MLKKIKRKKVLIDTSGIMFF